MPYKSLEKRREYNREYSRKWKADHPDETRLSWKKYKEANGDKLKEKRKEKYWEDPEVNREYQRKYKASNRDKINARRRELRKTDEYKEKHRQESILFRQRHPEKCREINKKHYQGNKTQYLLNNHKRRELLRSNYISALCWEMVKKQYDYTCLCCKKKEPDIKLTIDHIIPISKGGLNIRKNIQPLCLTCNLKKRNKTIDYRPEKRFKRSLVIYLSGKYSGKTKREISRNIEIARNYAIMLWEAGATVVTPHLNTQHFEQDCTCTYEDYIEGDLALLGKCDVIYMLEDWEQSGGARIEKDYARKEGIHIVFNNTELNEYWKELQ